MFDDAKKEEVATRHDGARPLEAAQAEAGREERADGVEDGVVVLRHRPARHGHLHREE